jgi:uncharacterized protein YegL
MKTKKSIYHFIVDKSTSMEGSEEQVVVGFNMQLAKMKDLALKYPEQEYLASVTFFDCDVHEEINFAPIDQVKPLQMASYVPDGMTALLDAIGGAIDNTIEKFSAEINAKEVSVVFIILTDGDENFSSLYTHALVSSKIQKLEDTGAWTFSFIGADFDASEISQQLNVRIENVISFPKSEFTRNMEFVSESMEEFEKGVTSGNRRSNFFSAIIEKTTNNENL